MTLATRHCFRQGFTVAAASDPQGAFFPHKLGVSTIGTLSEGPSSLLRLGCDPDGDQYHCNKD